MSNVLSIKELSIGFMIEKKPVLAVDGISLMVNEGEMVALVGESGCGKTLTASSILGLHPKTSIISSGEILINGNDMIGASSKEWNSVRGKDVSMIFQEPMTALNPLMKVGKQIAENAINVGISKAEAQKMTLEVLELVGLSDPNRVFSSYPHQLSGGMRQRIMIAMALINKPSLIVADEPTTALDVTIQAQILELIKEMNKKTNTAVMLITHDLGVVKSMCDRAYVMYAGRIVESGRVESLIKSPKHPYTKALLNSIPSFEKRGQTLETIKGIVPPLGKRKMEGCLYCDRCSEKMPICETARPTIKNIEDREIACHLF